MSAAPDPFEIRPARPGDADSLVACFDRVYGGSYVDPVFNDASLARDALASGRQCSVVAIAADGAVAGHMGLAPRTGALVAEMGNTAVDPHARGQHLVTRLTLALSARCRELGLVGFVHYPTTAHAVMQQLAAKGRGVELGVLLDYIPAETRYVGFEDGRGAGRIAVVAYHHALAPAPHRTVWLPPRHDAVLRRIYARLGSARTLRESRTQSDGTSRLRTRFEARRGLQRVEVNAVGADLGRRVAAEIARRPDTPALIDLPLSDPSVGAAAEAVSHLGFCFGALLPEYDAEGDVLRLQRLPGASAPPRLETTSARELLAYSLGDRVLS